MKKLWCLGRFADSIPYILKIDENIEFEAFIKVSESLILERRRQKNHKGTDEEEGKVDVKVVSKCRLSFDFEFFAECQVSTGVSTLNFLPSVKCRLSFDFEIFGRSFV